MKDNKFRAAIAKNPVLALFLGACPAMALTTGLIPALGIGCAALLVLVLSAAVMSLLGKAIPEKARVPACILVVAGFVSIVQLFMNAFLPAVYGMMGIYLAAAAVNLLFFGAAEESCGAGFGAALGRSFMTGLSFVLALAVMGAIREVFGSASIAGVALPFLENYKIPFLTQSAGGFVVFAILIAVINCFDRGERQAQPGFATAAAGLVDAAPAGEGE